MAAQERSIIGATAAAAPLRATAASVVLVHGVEATRETSREHCYLYSVSQSVEILVIPMTTRPLRYSCTRYITRAYSYKSAKV